MPETVIEIEAGFSETEKSAQSELQKLLWLFYARDETVNDLLPDATRDTVSRENAAMIIDGLKFKGFHLTNQNGN